MEASTTAPNNLSVVSDSEHECMEMPQYLSDSNNSNIQGVSTIAPHHVTMKSITDSGRSSMREDVSPYMHRIPFQSFKHVKSSSIDETGHYSHDEEVVMASSLHSKQRKALLPSHSNSFNAGYVKSNVTNVRATEGPPIRTLTHVSQNSINSSYIAEAPEGFRTPASYRGMSPHSRTSDYESNTPTPEITSNSMIDYDLARDHVPRLPQRNCSYSEKPWPKKHVAGSLYSPYAAKVRLLYHELEF